MNLGTTISDKQARFMPTLSVIWHRLILANLPDIGAIVDRSIDCSAPCQGRPRRISAVRPESACALNVGAAQAISWGAAVQE